MTTTRLYFSGERVGPQLRRSARQSQDKVNRVAYKTALFAAREIEALGSADIGAAPGRFGVRWTTGLHAPVTRGGGNIRIGVYHDVPYFRVFEFGAVIHGKPMLWIPLSFAKDAQGVRARDYPHRLFRVDRGGGKAPLLLASGGGKHTKAEPKYFGKESVRIPKKFHVVQIIRKVANQLKSIYREQFRADGR